MKALLLAVVLAVPAFPCSVVGTISGLTMFSQADSIIRAKAVGHAFPRSSQNAAGFVRFRILEQLRGRAPELILPGKLVDNDDWNDKPAPYDFVRPTGRSGSCYTNQYRAGAEYLLFLKKKQDGTLTTQTFRLELIEQVLRHFLVPIPSHA